MHIVYFDPYPNKFLEEYISDYSKLLESKGEEGITIRKLETVDEVLQEADVSPPPPLLTTSSLSPYPKQWIKIFKKQMRALSIVL